LELLLSVEGQFRLDQPVEPEESGMIEEGTVVAAVAVGSVVVVAVDSVGSVAAAAAAAVVVVVVVVAEPVLVPVPVVVAFEPDVNAAAERVVDSSTRPFACFGFFLAPPSSVQTAADLTPEV
jgi:hypothetical protein